MEPNIVLTDENGKKYRYHVECSEEAFNFLWGLFQSAFMKRGRQMTFETAGPTGHEPFSGLAT